MSALCRYVLSHNFKMVEINGSNIRMLDRLIQTTDTSERLDCTWSFQFLDTLIPVCMLTYCPREQQKQTCKSVVYRCNFISDHLFSNGSVGSQISNPFSGLATYVDVNISSVTCVMIWFFTHWNMTICYTSLYNICLSCHYRLTV
jgi:hypothetical protein